MVCPENFLNRVVQNRTKNSLRNFPTFPWVLVTDSKHGLPVLKATKTISRLLIPLASPDSNVCPYGDQPAQLAVIKSCPQPVLSRSAYALSALRFQLNPFPKKESRVDNKREGIPTALQGLYREKNASKKGVLEKKRNEDNWLKATTIEALEAVVERHQQEMRSLYNQELVPLMNANPFDPHLHSQNLSSEFIHDLEQYVELQNRPQLFFSLMQWLERDVAKRRWRSARTGETLTSAKALTLVMNSWTDRDGTRRKPAITCPKGVPLDYMQSVRRKNQPFITQEFANHAHGAFNHWLQEHIWQRFYDRYPTQCQLSPAQFFKQLGHSHFAFADAIYELHMPAIANPANTNFWSVLQFYLPFMSPWP